MATEVAELPPTASPFDWSGLIEPALPDPLEMFCSLPVGDNGEYYDLDLSPWARAVFRWWLDPEVTWIYLIQGSQTSKTVTMMGLLLYAARYDPGPAMWIAALEEEADKFLVLRLKPFLELADQTTRTGRKKDWRAQDLRIYGRQLLHLAYATSGRKLRSWPCRYLFGDECGIWPASVPEVGDPLEYVKKRTRRYRQNRKGIFATTPSQEEHPSWKEAVAAVFYRWHVPCPECGEYQYLTWHRIRFSHCRRADNTWDYERVKAETYYECGQCGAKLTDAHKLAMIAAGELVCIDPDTGDEVKPDPGNPARTLQVPATYSLFTPWGELAIGFLKAKAKGPEALRIFVTDELAEPWRQPTDSPDMETLGRCIDHERGRGTVPAAVVALTCGIDLQHTEAYWEVWGHGPDYRAWMIAHGVLPLVDHGLVILDDIITREYGGHVLSQTFIDSGDGKMTFDVYEFCRRHGRRVAPCKGQAASRQSKLVVPSAIDQYAGRKIRGGLTLYHVNTDHFKAAIHDRIKTPRGDPTEWRLHGDTGEDFLRQILAERRILTVDSRDRPVTRWRQIHRDNHFLDAAVYALAAAWYPLRTHTYRPGALAPDRRADGSGGKWLKHARQEGRRKGWLDG